jgi:hypothetical protein
LTLQTNKNGQYMHDAILPLEKGIRRVLKSQFNPSNPGKVMEILLDTGDNQIIGHVNRCNHGGIRDQRSNTSCQGMLDFDRQNRPPHHHRMSRGTGGSPLSEHHQSGGHWRKRGRHGCHHKTSRQQLHRHHSTHTRRQRSQGRQRLQLFNVMQTAIDGADHPLRNNVL